MWKCLNLSPITNLNNFSKREILFMPSFCIGWIGDHFSKTIVNEDFYWVFIAGVSIGTIIQKMQGSFWKIWIFQPFRSPMQNKRLLIDTRTVCTCRRMWKRNSMDKLQPIRFSEVECEYREELLLIALFGTFSLSWVRCMNWKEECRPKLACTCTKILSLLWWILTIRRAGEDLAWLMIKTKTHSKCWVIGWIKIAK